MSVYEVMAIVLAMDAAIVVLFVGLVYIDKVRGWAWDKLVRRLVG